MAQQHRGDDLRAGCHDQYPRPSSLESPSKVWERRSTSRKMGWDPTGGRVWNRTAPSRFFFLDRWRWVGPSASGIPWHGAQPVDSLATHLGWDAPPHIGALYTNPSCTVSKKGPYKWRMFKQEYACPSSFCITSLYRKKKANKNCLNVSSNDKLIGQFVLPFALPHARLHVCGL